MEEKLPSVAKDFETLGKFVGKSQQQKRNQVQIQCKGKTTLIIAHYLLVRRC